MMKNLSIKQILILCFSFVLLLAGYSALFGEHGYLSLRKMERRSSEYNERIERLKKENQDIRSEIRALKTNPAMIEKIAREELGLVRQGEIKMTSGKQLDDPTKSASTPNSRQ
ncbi:MAG: septum formation initiator family protein [Terriglobia bacterium]